jgi:HK97 family phage major capsid protein
MALSPLRKLKRHDQMYDTTFSNALQKKRLGIGGHFGSMLTSAGVTVRECEIAGHFVMAMSQEEEIRSRAWLREAGVSLVLAKASSESIGGGGGVLVPQQIEPSICALRDLNGIARRFARVLQMGSDEKHWPRRVAGVTARFVTPENTAITGSVLSFDDIGLFAKKAAIFFQYSKELSEDEIVNLGAYFLIDISTGFWRLEDDCCFVGDGTSAYGGIRGLCTLLVDGNHNAGKAGAAATHSSLDKIDGPDLAALMGLLPSYAWPGARWYCSGPGVGLCLARLAAIGGGSIGVAPDGLAFMGFGVSIVPSMPGAGSQVGKIVVAFGDLSLAVALGSRGGVTVGISDHRYLENDQIAMRGTERFDVNVANLGDNTNPGPIVGLTATS